MLTLSDGRSELWQWDTSRTLSVPVECSQVHFSNKVFGRSIDVDVVDGVSIIPDVLLQTDRELTAWAFVGTAESGYTKISKVFKVNKRNKPADYVFTPPEQTTLAELVERLNEIEENQDPDAIKNAVDEYLQQNPVDFPVDSVNGKTGDVKLSAEDVGAISQDKLQDATNEALAQAKASGEFDGRPGDPGRTPVKGEDYYTDEDKSEIVDQVVEEINPILDGKAAMPLTIYADNAPTTGENSVSGIPIFTIDYSPSDLKKYQDAGARVKIVRFNRHYEMYEATDESAKFRFVEPTDTQVDGYHAVLDTNKAVTITRTTHKSKMESTTGGAVGKIPRIKSLNSKGLPQTWEFVDITEILPVYNGEVEEV